MKSSDRLSLRWAARPPSVDKNRLALSGNAWVQTRPLGESNHIGLCAATGVCKAYGCTRRFNIADLVGASDISVGPVRVRCPVHGPTLERRQPTQPSTFVCPLCPSAEATTAVVLPSDAFPQVESTVAHPLAACPHRCSVHCERPYLYCSGQRVACYHCRPYHRGL